MRQSIQIRRCCATGVSRSLLVIGAFLAVAGISPRAGADETVAAGVPAPPVDFNSQVRPIFNRHCISCHGGVKQAAGVSFIRSATAFAEAESGERPIVPGDVAKSNLLARVTAGEDERMPPADHGRALSAEEIATLRRWIEQGAVWAEHWAYVSPKAPPLPTVRDEAWCLQSLDRFVQARLEAEHLDHAKVADRRTWLRRVTFDLTGLPPTADELKAFLTDESPQAWETVVDRLLASPAYGERWSAVWLDLARYADTMGFERDPGRIVWPYRDWLIRAFNDDMPFDQFTIKQLAGDLLEERTLDDLVATTFHRNTQTNTEGGTDDEEFRIQAVIDRVNTTWQVWQSTTFGCTQCHSHPYAPFDHDEYYKFMAFFNNSQDCDLVEEFPLLNVPIEESNRSKSYEVEKRIGQLRRSLFGRFNEVATSEASSWKNLPLDHATSTGTAKLRLRTFEGFTEVLAEGTISNKPVYTIESPLPAGVTRLTALRIEALPLDLEAALRIPEPGFVLSRFQADVVSLGSGKPRKIDFEVVYSDEAEPMLDPQDSLDKNDNGWSAYSRISQPRSAVFLPLQAVELKEGDRLRFTLNQNRVVDGSLAMFIRRGRFSISDNPRWTQLLETEISQAERKELAALIAQRSKFAGVPVPVMREVATSVGRHTYQFERGNWLTKGAEVHADVPALLPKLPAEVPHDRLAFAKWLVNGENPLTARVMVNRFWMELFGTGLVETAEDFGSSGATPSQPELLDHLALRFQNDLHWSMKRLLREIVLSGTYRQDSKTSPKLRDRDPMNRLLARGPRNRLTAEMVRDQALAVSGLLSRKMYGPPVMPPQPEGIWRSAYNGNSWKTAEGEDRYRRGVYVFYKRTSGYPSFLAFDAPSREVCTPRRIVTNTPLQALTTLNDEAYVECAKGLGKRMNEVGPNLEEKLKWGYVTVSGHEPDAATLASLVKLYGSAMATFEETPSQSPKLGASNEESALAIVGNALLNLDAALIR